MPFTTDSELDLLFPTEHIPDEARKQLPPDLHVSTTSYAAPTPVGLIEHSSVLLRRPTTNVAT